MMQDLSDEERGAIQVEIERLRQDHRDLDAAILALSQMSAIDQLQMQRFKKRKLVLRDKVAKLEDQLTPDIIA